MVYHETLLVSSLLGIVFNTHFPQTCFLFFVVPSVLLFLRTYSIQCEAFEIGLYLLLIYIFECNFYILILLYINSLSNSCWHSANADVIADVKSKILVSLRHFFANMIFSATSKVQNYQSNSTENSPYPNN